MHEKSEGSICNPILLKVLLKILVFLSYLKYTFPLLRYSNHKNAVFTLFPFLTIAYHNRCLSEALDENCQTLPGVDGSDMMNISLLPLRFVSKVDHQGSLEFSTERQGAAKSRTHFMAYQTGQAL